ncbi:MAG: methionine adenosyltransferase domain-containing protein, partial [Bacteroidales bacterium]|nr:methionine adenosyltransferase domain-containing protein [Bacteroidales bacterium]
KEIFDLRPYSIVKRLGLKNPIYLPTATYGHFGRTPYTAEVEMTRNGKKETKQVEFFTWEKTDYVDTIKVAFNL